MEILNSLQIRKKLKYVQKTFLMLNFLETNANSMLSKPIMCCEKLKINVIYNIKSMSELKTYNDERT